MAEAEELFSDPETAESPGDPETASPRPLFAGLSDISISQDIPVEGEINIPTRSRMHESDISTLNEPVQRTIIRDLKAVGKKFLHVLYPSRSHTLLRDFVMARYTVEQRVLIVKTYCKNGDLWGPLILCVALSLILQGGSADSENDGGPQFAEVFVIVWFGAVTIALNSKLLGGNISSFQRLSALGYRVLALTVAMLVCRLALLAEPGRITFMIRLFVVIVMFGWSLLASYVVASREPLNHRALAMYPIYLCYFVISWMILSFPSE